jgi:hypothetical protein
VAETHVLQRVATLGDAVFQKAEHMVCHGLEGVTASAIIAPVRAGILHQYGLVRGVFYCFLPT